MKRIFGIVLAISLTAISALGEEKRSATPVRSGYAVITLTSGAAPGLVAFETFGLKGRGNEGGTMQAGVLPSGLTTNAVLFVETNGRLSKNLGIAIVNPNAADLNLTLTLRKSDGTDFLTANLTVPAHKQVSAFVTQLFSNQVRIPSDFIGTLAVTSNGTTPLPFAAIGLRFKGENFSTIPLTSLQTPTTGLPVITTGVGGEGALLLPQFATGGGWATEVVIANSAASSITVRLDLFNTDGTPLTATLNGKTASSFPNLVIPAHGVLELEPPGGDDDHDNDD